MTMFRFTKLINKVLNHTKKQTIRILTPHRRNYPIKTGINKGQIYTLFKAGDANIVEVKTIKLGEITEEIAQLDGFDNVGECVSALVDMHELDDEDNYDKILDVEFNVISFVPQWEPQVIVKIKDLWKLRGILALHADLNTQERCMKILDRIENEVEST